MLVAVITYDALWYGGMMSGGAAIDSVDGLTSFGLGVGILAVAMTALAVSLVLWLNDRGFVSVNKVLALGAALGNVPLAVIVFVVILLHPGEMLSGEVGRYWYGLPGLAQRVALGSVVGMSSAAAFWCVALRSTASRGLDT